ncbi:MAG: hypothetical protein AAFA34_04160 [Thermoplasmata archaeon]|jgi:hypothetical protein
MPYITVRSSVIPRCVALATEDPVLYMELAAMLKEGGIPTISVRPGEAVPRSATVVITSPAEAFAIAHPRVVVVRAETDRRALFATIVDDPDPDPRPDRIVVGIDPGPRPGYAVVSPRGCLARGCLENPESARGLVVGLRAEFVDRPIVYRVGMGDPVARNRVINGLLEAGATVEIAREEGTTPRGRRRPRDAEAALKIAQHPGRGVRGRFPVRATPGEVANLQRLSREGSGGRITISKEDARRVLEGNWSLSEAISSKLAPARPVAHFRWRGRREPL